MGTIDQFNRQHAFLSNFFMRPITYKGKVWPSVEHAYQVRKSLLEEEQESIRAAAKPGKAKRLGGKKELHLRPDWEDVKVEIMREFLWRKFTQHPDLGRRLLQTGEAILIEGNLWHDNIWGDCACEHCRDLEGQNLLGKLLMEVRERLRRREDM